MNKRVIVTSDAKTPSVTFEGVVIGFGITEHPQKDLRIRLKNGEIVSPSTEAIIKVEIL